MASSVERREQLKAVYEQARACPKCPELVATRTQVVFGAGNADADLMFVGEAPGANEDRRGLPFVGQAGMLLEQLLGEIGLQRKDVFIANVLKCRPPGNRDPLPTEIEHCQGYLMRQLELIQPKVVCTLGNFATKLLRDDPAGITRVHGRDEVRVIGRRAVRLYPLFHPAAALYTPRMLETLRADFQRIPELLAMDAPPQPAPEELELLAEAEEARADARPPEGAGPAPLDGAAPARDAVPPAAQQATPPPAAQLSLASAVEEPPAPAAGDAPLVPGADPDPGASRGPEPPIEGQLELF